MSARRVSREPYRLRRNRRELWKAIGVAALIVLLTVVAVWILAPSDESDESDDRPSFPPTLTVPTAPSPGTSPETAPDATPDADTADPDTADPDTAPPAGG